MTRPYHDLRSFEAWARKERQRLNEEANAAAYAELRRGLLGEAVWEVDTQKAGSGGMYLLRARISAELIEWATKVGKMISEATDGKPMMEVSLQGEATFRLEDHEGITILLWDRSKLKALCEEYGIRLDITEAERRISSERQHLARCESDHAAFQEELKDYIVQPQTPQDGRGTTGRETG